MGLDELLTGEVSQPKEERQRLVLEGLRGAFGRLQEGFREDVRVIEAALEVAAEAKADHALERLAVAGEQLGHSRGIARGSALEQDGEIFRVGHGRDPPTLLCADRSLFSSGSFNF